MLSTDVCPSPTGPGLIMLSKSGRGRYDQQEFEESPRQPHQHVGPVLGGLLSYPCDKLNLPFCGPNQFLRSRSAFPLSFPTHTASRRILSRCCQTGSRNLDCLLLFPLLPVPVLYSHLDKFWTLNCTISVLCAEISHAVFIRRSNGDHTCA